jgi:hypothetical protein
MSLFSKSNWIICMTSYLTFEKHNQMLIKNKLLNINAHSKLTLNWMSLMNAPNDSIDQFILKYLNL